jgi:large subunit ribosomal protein L29
MKRKELLKEINGLSTEDLATRARGMAEELMKLRFRNASGQLTQGHRIGELKRDLARVQTILTAKTMSSKKTSAAAAKAK